MEESQKKVNSYRDVELYFEGKTETHFFECSCRHPDHLLRFSVDSGESFPDWPPEAFIEIILNPEFKIFRRIWKALLYIFKKKPRFGHFDCWMLNPEDAERMIEVLNSYLELKEIWKEKQNG